MDNDAEISENQQEPASRRVYPGAYGSERMQADVYHRESAQIGAGVNPAARLGSALRRRTRYAWRRLTRGKRRPATEAAFDWLLRQDVACPGATAAAIETVVAYGAVDVARRWAAWLLSIQRPDGSLPTASMQTPSIFNTTQAVRGWNALREEMPEVGPAIAAARRFLASQADESAEPVPVRGPTAELARQAVGWYASGGWGKAQRCPSTNDSGASLRSPTSHPATSQAADARARADRAMADLVRRQRRDGSFGRASHLEAFWTAKYFLDAAPMQVRAAFDADRGPQSDLPQQIDPADGRMEAVRRWFATLPSDARLADVGCGKGRFLRQLGREFPDAQLTGIDVSPAMLAHLPEGVAAIEGGLLRIPAADGALDGAFAVESLEHALLPARAVAELCRIVRPGGRVLIVDKHAARQPLSEHEPWERWFTPEELTGWLRCDCDEVSVEPVAHSEGRGGKNLFLCATGKRRVAS